jgi:hypothetical protein
MGAPQALHRLKPVPPVAQTSVRLRSLWSRAPGAAATEEPIGQEEYSRKCQDEVNRVFIEPYQQCERNEGGQREGCSRQFPTPCQQHARARNGEQDNAAPCPKVWAIAGVG